MPVSTCSRYRNLAVVEVTSATRGRTRSLPLRRLPEPPAGAGHRHRITGYDTADLLALRYLGREDLFWRVLDANGGRLPGAFVPGEMLEIPPLDTATRVERRGP